MSTTTVRVETEVLLADGVWACWETQYEDEAEALADLVRLTEFYKDSEVVTGQPYVFRVVRVETVETRTVVNPS
jgi:hypothetical protein